MAIELRHNCETGETEKVEYTPAPVEVEPQPAIVAQLAAALGITEAEMAAALSQVAG
jgi:hypothetical protein